MIRDIQRDVEMMQSPREWSRWPFLPLTRIAGQLGDRDYCGFLFADGRPVVYTGVIFMISGEKGQTWEDVLRPYERREYASFEVLAAEYRVD